MIRMRKGDKDDKNAKITCCTNRLANKISLAKRDCIEFVLFCLLGIHCKISKHKDENDDKNNKNPQMTKGGFGIPAVQIGSLIKSC